MSHIDDYTQKRPNLKRPGDPEMNSSDHRSEHESADYAQQDEDVGSRSNWRPFHGRWQPQSGVNSQVDRSASQQTPHPASQPNTAGGVPRRPRRLRNARKGNGTFNTPGVSQDPSFPVSQSGTEAPSPFGTQIAPPFGNSNFTFGATGMPVPMPGTFPVAPNAFANPLLYQQNPFLQPQHMPWNFMQPWNPIFWNNAIQQMSFMSTLASASVNTSNQQTEGLGGGNNGAAMAMASKDSNTEIARRKGPPPTVAPVPTKEYLDQALQRPKKLPAPQPLLVILDLNGTLVYRKSRKFPPQFVKRPGLDHFLKQLLSNYTVMIWSSSQPKTVDAICRRIMSSFDRRRLAAEWARDKLGLTNDQYKEKVQVYKRLEEVWTDESIQAKYPKSKNKLGKRMYKILIEGEKPGSEDGQTSADDSAAVPSSNLRWDQTNTVLIDDSKLKAASQPYNLLEVPEFTNDPNVDESNVLKTVLKRLKKLARVDDVSRMIHHWELHDTKITREKTPSSNSESDVSDATSTASSSASDAEEDEPHQQQQQPQQQQQQQQSSDDVETAKEKMQALSIAEARKKKIKARKKEKMRARRLAKKQERLRQLEEKKSVNNKEAEREDS